MRRPRRTVADSNGPHTLTSPGALVAPGLEKPAAPSAKALAFAETEVHAPENDEARSAVESAPPEASPASDIVDSRWRSLPPDLHERFQEPKVLGAGGMGTVYKARDNVLGRDVALKLLHPGNPQLDETLFREARSQARLEHENVCKVYEVGGQGEHRYLVMQLIQGIPLDQAKRDMTLEQKVRIVRTIAAALHEVHRHGFVHRDIKPSNIMVELSEDGIYKPFLMDFGLAREIGAQGQTVTGHIAGTPAFMAPEQARGEIRKLDRRTDVYSLGATLYDLLAGRPPFVATDLYSLLYEVQVKEPPALRTLDKTIPVDVESIVMKCLEKEPQHRFESAKALGEDLQRFLDGELVRRASIFFLAYKKAKRHQVAVLVTALCLCVAAMLVVTWVRAERAAERQAIFSRELGEDIQAMELFLRTAHELPTHDIERDRDVIRARLRKIEARMKALGALGEGPGHYAIGRGHLALQEYEEAREHFDKAIATGYASPNLDYALGLSLGELYRKALDEIERIDNPEKKKARLDEVNAELKEPALRRLGSSLSGDFSSPAYVKGLIALYSEDYEEAKKQAREAFENEPWLYEAKKLEADAFFAQGSKYRLDGAYDYAKMMTYFGPAAEAYAEAAEIGRSDPGVFLASCEFWRQSLTSSPNDYAVSAPLFAKGAAVCTQGIRSSPRAIEPHTHTALLYQTWAHKLIFSPGAPANEASRFMKEGVVMAKEAAALGPNDAMAQYAYGTALLNEVYYDNDRGLDSLPVASAAIETLEKAVSLNPSFLWTHNELCKANTERLRQLSVRGLDTRTAMDGAREACERAIALEPTWAFSRVALAQACLYQIIDRLQYGAAKGAAFDEVLRLLEDAQKNSPKLWMIYSVMARVYYFQAIFEASEGHDPEAALAKAERTIEELRGVLPGAEAITTNLGLIAMLRARREALAGRDPMHLLVKAREAFATVTKGSPWDVDYQIYRARAEVVAASWAVAQGDANDSLFEDALAPLESLLSEERFHPELYQKSAELHALKARWLLSRKESPQASILRGLERVEKALALHPRMALAMETKGKLLAVKALSSKDESERKKLQALAKEAFAMALEQNPTLRPEIDEEKHLLEK